MYMEYLPYLVFLTLVGFEFDMWSKLVGDYMKQVPTYYLTNLAMKWRGPILDLHKIDDKLFLTDFTKKRFHKSPVILLACIVPLQDKDFRNRLPLLATLQGPVLRIGVKSR